MNRPLKATEAMGVLSQRATNGAALSAMARGQTSARRSNCRRDPLFARRLAEQLAAPSDPRPRYTPSGSKPETERSIRFERMTPSVMPATLATRKTTASTTETLRSSLEKEPLVIGGA